MSLGVAITVLRARDVALHARTLVKLAVEDGVVGTRVSVRRCAAQEERVLSAGRVENTGGRLAEDVLHREVDAAGRDASAWMVKGSEISDFGGSKLEPPRWWRALSGRASLWECRAAQSCQVRPEEAMGASWGTAKGGTWQLLRQAL